MARIEIKALYLYPQNYCANKRCLLMILFVYLKCNSLFILQTNTFSHTALGNYEKTQCCLWNFYFLLSTLPCSKRRCHGLKWSYLLHRGNSISQFSSLSRDKDWPTCGDRVGHQSDGYKLLCKMLIISSCKNSPNLAVQRLPRLGKNSDVPLFQRQPCSRRKTLPVKTSSIFSIHYFEITAPPPSSVCKMQILILKLNLSSVINLVL